ncbi:hypothetical protein HG536_0H00490 [Torulaspora globosa]|uniref:Zn(2)-C6 fungal-type domain-containing protein n=1 Tax=Torulaspora globosa TaxID=48254 RepID=A0A7G3ZMD8_9SACH|nr:uncharacterized protein HG536_0H00490 [Torulaspora globosa]QLL34674.1 hypothetical protein HG536_0H00490 [Torulaspora globosa]
MSDEEPDRLAGRASRGQVKGKRAKTFTGCWTCRSRKVKCDLRRPACERCEKSGLECGGYDIKLRWTKCINFDMYGIQVPTAPAYSTNEEQQYRRRNIDFVRYGEEYKYYEDMDEELSALHKPPPEKIENGKTWLIKKFGVFRGTEPAVELRDSLPKGAANHLESSKSESTTVLDTAIEQTGAFDFLENDPFLLRFSTGHEWISKELEDDVLSSATAFRGFPMTTLPLSSTSTTTTTPMDYGFCKNGGIEGQFNAANVSDSDRVENSAQTVRSLDIDKDTEASALSYDQHTESQTHGLSGEEEIMIDCSAFGATMPSVAMETIDNPWPGPNIFGKAASNKHFVGPPATSLVVHGLTRFLLDYYFRNVADIMPVVAIPTNPWKTLFFPRALQALGEIAGLGTTSNSRNSLLNSLLAVSCFNLSSKFARDSECSQYFIKLGIEFRSQASCFLRLCLAETAENERYKDVLTALLSINSVDVVWGTMRDCQHHLTMCEDFVKARMRMRPKLSHKAKVLHKIFSFLKLIQDSTSLDKVGEEEITLKSVQNIENFDERAANNKPGSLSKYSEQDEETEPIKRIRYKELLDEMDGKIKIQSVEECEKTKIDRLQDDNTPLFMDVVSESYYSVDPKQSDYSILGTDDLYALPKSLILLFSDCVHLAKHKEYYKIRHIALPQQFIRLLQKLESRLMTWRPEWKFLKADSEEFINDTVKGVYHHTMSFYNGLLIYFFTMIRELNESDLQTYVEEVLLHLKALGELVTFKGIRIVPLMWQGFIAGCGSTDLRTQKEFKSWAAGLAQNGIGSYWGARQVMFEVWRRRKNKEGGDDWYTVYKDWEVNLMLS